MINDYRDLQVWQRSIEAVKDIYIFTRTFPRAELFGLTAQMRRSSVSISSNIAEGYMRQHTNEYIQFIYHALGSCGELYTQIKKIAFGDNLKVRFSVVRKVLYTFLYHKISNILNYMSDESAESISGKVDHLIRMLRNLIKGLRK
jgi:four helix bundle protein